VTLIKTDDQPDGLGYFLVDQRASGIPVFGGQALFEADTYTCSHCNAVVVMNPARTRERYKCKGCNHHICDSCAALRVAGSPCRTMKQIVDEHMERVTKQSSPIILPPK
jgi:hypothetical protein